MSNTNASEENVESPSTYGNEAYKEHRKQEKRNSTDKNKKSVLQNQMTLNDLGYNIAWYLTTYI